MKHTASIDRVSRVGEVRALGESARNRFVVPFTDAGDHSPFIVLVEDWIAPGAGFDSHPHRGFETVTFMLDGELESGDHLSADTVLRPGDVQWMTAGRGITHGGRPHGGREVHALQLWLNLPRSLKQSAPGTRVQGPHHATALLGDGMTAAVYGAPRSGPALPPWSQWPMTLTDLRLLPGAEYRLPVNSDERALLYMLDGSVSAGDDARLLSPGDIGWIAPVATVGRDEERELMLRALTETRVVAYTSRPINEPMVVRGPFVMNTNEEIRQAFAELKDGTFLDQADGKVHRR